MNTLRAIAYQQRHLHSRAAQTLTIDWSMPQNAAGRAHKGKLRDSQPHDRELCPDNRAQAQSKAVMRRRAAVKGLQSHAPVCVLANQRIFKQFACG